MPPGGCASIHSRDIGFGSLLGVTRGISLPGFAYPDTPIWYPDHLKQHCYHFAVRYRVVPLCPHPVFLGTTYLIEEEWKDLVDIQPNYAYHIKHYHGAKDHKAARK